MIINMIEGATEAEIQHVIDSVTLCGYHPHVIRGTERTIVAAVAKERPGVIVISAQLDDNSRKGFEIARELRTVVAAVSGARAGGEPGGDFISR